MPLDLLLIHPGGRKQVYQGLSDLAAVEPPIWAAMIAGMVRVKGYRVEILDTNAENMEPSEAAEHVIRKNPVLAAVIVYGHQPSASTQHMPSVRAVCEAVKQRNPEQKILLAGGHAAALPEQTLKEEPVDFVSSGEGPQTIFDLLEQFRNPKPDLSRAADLWYRDQNQTRFTFTAPLLEPLDEKLPEAAWDLLPMEKYRAHNWHAMGHESASRYAAIYTTLGCPYHCHFCCIQSPFKSGERAAGYASAVNSYRFWKPETVLGWIDRLVQGYGVKHLKIADEMFVLNRKHVREICEGLIHRGYRLNLWAYARVDTVHEDDLPLLKQAGFHWLALGIESASDQVREDVAKPFRQDAILTTVRKIQNAGIHVIANYIFGLPEDTLETLRETLDLAVSLNTEYANLYCTMAYPGSSLYDRALREGWALPASWSGYSQHAADARPLDTRYVSGEEVLRFRDEAFQIYFNRPDYLSMIESKFGAQAKSMILRMLSIPLRRGSSNSPKSLSTQSVTCREK